MHEKNSLSVVGSTVVGSIVVGAGKKLLMLNMSIKQNITTNSLVVVGLTVVGSNVVDTEINSNDV